MGRTSAKKGRIRLTLAFALILAGDLFMLFYARVPNHPIPRMFGYVLIALVWTSILFGALWLRKIWGRYLLLAVLMATTLALLVADLAVVDMRRTIQTGPFLSMVVATIFYFVSVVIVMFSRNIRRLTSRAWE